MQFKVQRLGTKFKMFKPFKWFKTLTGLFDGLNDLNGFNCCAHHARLSMAISLL